MTLNKIMRTGTLAVLLATGALVQGCSSPSFFAREQQAMAPVDTGVYSSSDWGASLEATMTSNNGGGD